MKFTAGEGGLGGNSANCRPNNLKHEKCVGELFQAVLNDIFTN